MTSFSAGDIVWVPFPHVESDETRSRPALVISNTPIGSEGALFWAMMVTNALRPGWPGDLIIEDLAAAGLSHPSKIRTAKIATLEAQGAEPIGRIDDALLAEVRARMAAYLDAPRQDGLN